MERRGFSSLGHGQWFPVATIGWGVCTTHKCLLAVLKENRFVFYPPLLSFQFLVQWNDVAALRNIVWGEGSFQKDTCTYWVQFVLCIGQKQTKLFTVLESYMRMTKKINYYFVVLGIFLSKKENLVSSRGLYSLLGKPFFEAMHKYEH